MHGVTCHKGRVYLFLFAKHIQLNAKRKPVLCKVGIDTLEYFSIGTYQNHVTKAIILSILLIIFSISATLTFLKLTIKSCHFCTEHDLIVQRYRRFPDFMIEYCQQ